MTATAAERAARRDSIPVEVVSDPEEAEKAVAAGVVPPKDAPAEPEPAAEESEEPVEGEEPVEPEPAADEPPKPAKGERQITQAMLDRRLAKEVAKTKAAQDAAAALEARLAVLERKDDAGTLTPEQQREQIRLEAQKIAIETSYNNACNGLAEAADKEETGFAKRYASFQEDVGELPRNVIDTLLNLENGHSTLNYLLDHPDEAEKIVGMNDKRATVELAKVSMKLATPIVKPLSKAPTPIKPIGGAPRTVSAPTDNDSDEAWFAKRQATKKARDYSNR